MSLANVRPEDMRRCTLFRTFRHRWVLTYWADVRPNGNWLIAAEISRETTMQLRRFDDANLWSGCYRDPSHGLYGSKNGAHLVPTVAVTLRLRNWSLPFSVTVGGHLLSKPGLTFGVGPVYISWSLL